MTADRPDLRKNKMNTCGIYGIRNMVSSKWYIGQSCNIEERKRSHYSHLKNGTHFNEYLQRAFNKYGFDNFEFRVLEETEEGLDLLDGEEILDGLDKLRKLS